MKILSCFYHKHFIRINKDHKILLHYLNAKILLRYAKFAT